MTAEDPGPNPLAVTSLNKNKAEENICNTDQKTRIYFPFYFRIWTKLVQVTLNKSSPCQDKQTFLQCCLLHACQEIDTDMHFNATLLQIVKK